MIELVTHCYCPPHIPHYAHMLRWQYSSLLHHGQGVDVRLTVCYTDQDKTTVDMLQWIRTVITEQADELHFGYSVDVQTLCLDPSRLFRRAIGRDIIACRTDADVVWFADVDYLVGNETLQYISQTVKADSGLKCPAHIRICRDHVTGDQMVTRAEEQKGPFPHPDPKQFRVRRQKIAIGGVQIIGGRTANKIGYCHDTKWTRPVDPAAGFRSCAGDRVFRRNLSTERLPIPNVYRLRHSIDGRDYDKTGTYKGKGIR